MKIFICIIPSFTPLSFRACRGISLSPLGPRPSKIIFRAPRPKNQFSSAIAMPPHLSFRACRGISLAPLGHRPKEFGFSQGFAKNQIPSAIAMPPLKTRTNIVAGGHYLFHLQRESRTQSVWRCRWCHFLPTCNSLPFHLQRIQHAPKTKTMRKRSWPRAEGCTRLPPTINVKVTKVTRTASTFATPPPMYVQKNGLAARFWCTYIV